jgi:hypothetical protein
MPSQRVTFGLPCKRAHRTRLKNIDDVKNMNQYRMYNLKNDTLGTDLLEPFPRAPRQLRFLVVALDYLNKWIEAEPLATITLARVHTFSFKTIICCFGLPGEIVITDNDKHFRELVEGL